MGDMVEQVAKALASEFEAIVEKLSGQTFVETKVQRPSMATWTAYARAAIEAMREPTNAMLNAGDSQMPQIAKGEDITTGYDALKAAWPDMIDEALRQAGDGDE